MSSDEIDSEEERRERKETRDARRKVRSILGNLPLARWMGYTESQDEISDEEAKPKLQRMSARQWFETKKDRSVPPGVEKKRLQFDNAPHMLWGQVEPMRGNLGQRFGHLPLLFSTILPCPFSLYRIISISARARDNRDFNSRLRVLIYSSKYPLKFVCDIGFRFISLKLHKTQDTELDDLEVVESTIREYNFSILIGPQRFYFIMDNELVPQDFDISPGPLVFPGEYVEVRGTIDFVSQFHIRTVYPYTWPPQQNRHNMEIFDAYFHYTIGVHVKPGHCFIFTFRPYEVKGGVGFQLKAGPYRQTPISVFGYFDSPRPVEIQGTNDKFEFEPPEHGRYFPFKFDKENRVAILMCKDEFKIAINGKYYHKYRYRQSNLPGDLTDVKINTDKGTRVLCKSFDNSFIEDYEHGERELVRFSKLDKSFDQGFYWEHYGEL